MKKRLGLLGSVAIATLMMAGAVQQAQAVPIAGGSELSTNGSDNFTGSSTTFTISFLNPGNIGGTLGSFATVFGAVPPAINGVVTFTNFSDTSTNFQLYSATVGANTTALNAATITSFTFTGGTLPSLKVDGTGSLTLTGFDATPGNWELTTQGPTGTANVTFSNTSIATGGVPEPTSMAILGSALLFSFLAIRKKYQA